MVLIKGMLRMRVSDEEQRYLKGVYNWIRFAKYCGPVSDKDLQHNEEILCSILQLMGNNNNNNNNGQLI